MRRDVSVRGLGAAMRCQAGFLVRGWLFCVLAGTAGCNVDNKVSALQDSGAGIGTPEAGPSAPESPIISLPDPRTTDGGGVCPTLSCNSGASQFCGDLGDACGQTLHCPACPAGKTCKNSVCVSDGTSCLTGCTVPGGTYCGTIGDGCGGTLPCGTDCPQPGWKCAADHICKGDPSVCTAKTCLASSGDHYCGKIGDGCGGTLECGNTCPGGWSCVDNLCVGLPPVCTALTCATDSGDHYCDTIGNGCGGTLECGLDCPAGWTCDKHVCKATPPTCTRAACTTAGGDQYCGTIGDGCGWLARLRSELSWRMDLREFRVRGRAPVLQFAYLRHGRRRTVLWQGREWMRGHVELSGGLSAGWMGVRQ